MERGISRSEVVEGDSESAPLQLLHKPCRPGHVLEGGAFRDLENQSIPPAMTNSFIHIGQEFLMKKMAGSDIQRNPQRATRAEKPIPKGPRLPEGVKAQHPDQDGILLDLGHEGSGKKHPVPLLPADQHLHPFHLSGPAVELGLDPEDQIAIFDGGGKAPVGLDASLQGARDLAAEKPDGVPPAPFCGVEGLVRMGEKIPVAVADL